MSKNLTKDDNFMENSDDEEGSEVDFSLLFSHFKRIL